MQIATLMSGALIAQVVTLAFIPIITRLYTPEEFGLYSAFFALISIIGSVSSLKYDQAIMLPKSDKDAQALLFLSSILTFIFTLLSFFLIIIFYDFILNYFDGNKFIIYFIPIGIFSIGMVQILNAYSSRNQFYKTLSKVRVLNAFSVVSIQGSIRYIMSLDGLIIGKIIADLISLFTLIKFHTKKQTLHLSSLSKRRIKVVSKKYDHFPKYQSITVFLNSISQNIPILLLTSLYSIEIAGFYALTIRVLRTPITLIGSATREVYYQKASKMYANNENFFNLYFKTTLGLLKLFIIPFILILFFGDYIFSFVFGQQWIISGEYSKILIFWYLFAFINSPSIMTYSILHIQSIQLKIEILSLFLRVIALYTGYYIYNDVINSIILFVIASVFINILLILIIYNKLASMRKNYEI
jgi:O-antigen/teichoic acid export membrane protein